jgi:hypothetical protein
LYLKIAVRIILQWLNKGEQENANGILGEADFIPSHKKSPQRGWGLERASAYALSPFGTFGKVHFNKQYSYKLSTMYIKLLKTV